MSQYFSVHPVNPQLRLIQRTVDIIQDGGLIVYPTDSCYALGCRLGDKDAVERMRSIRRLERDHDFALVCRDLSEIATYAKVDNWAYRLLRSFTPGPYTFILRATHEVPKRLVDSKRRSIGIRVPDNAITQALLATLGEPIISSTLQLPGDELPLTEPEEIRERLERQVDAIVDGGVCGVQPTTVIDLTGGEINIVRRGKGDVAALPQ